MKSVACSRDNTFCILSVAGDQNVTGVRMNKPFVWTTVVRQGHDKPLTRGVLMTRGVLTIPGMEGCLELSGAPIADKPRSLIGRSQV